MAMIAAAALMVSAAGSVGAQDHGSFTFGHCAAFTSRANPVGPVHGEFQREFAVSANPHGADEACPGPNPTSWFR